MINNICLMYLTTIGFRIRIKGSDGETKVYVYNIVEFNEGDKGNI